ncbi:MAG TPA: peptidylprolyl isomerase [Fimbriimonadaceae bacterium]|nr:peptidylprolyl isomerase [Fimbriimonadaceae bacterium]HRJ32152.1 peptidylprolyl isomerase [Fimbriimonadaceae bacterium]
MKQWFLAAIAALSCWASAQLPLDKPVLTVNGESISGAEYYRRMEFLTGVGRMINGRFLDAAPGFLTMQRLLDERLLLQIAKEKSVAPTKPEIDALLKERLDEDPKFLENLARVGIPKEDVEYQISLEIAEFKLVTMGINVTDQEVEKFYNDNPALFTTPKMFKLSVISVRDEAAKAQVDAQLGAGRAFAEVAKDLSVDASRLNNGLLGSLPANALSDLVIKELEKTKIGSATAWIKGEINWVKFKIEDITPERKQALDPPTRTATRRKLMMDRGRVRNNLDQWMREARQKAKVTVNQPQFERSVKQYLGQGGS